MSFFLYYLHFVVDSIMSFIPSYRQCSLIITIDHRIDSFIQKVKLGPQTISLHSDVMVSAVSSECSFSSLKIASILYPWLLTYSNI